VGGRDETVEAPDPPANWVTRIEGEKLGGSTLEQRDFLGLGGRRHAGGARVAAVSAGAAQAAGSDHRNAGESR
jgi:hypothetical protein